MTKFRNVFWLAQGMNNQRFRSIFFKNWLIVFLCIIIPLTGSVYVVQQNAMQNQLQEIDNGVYRSAQNTTATFYRLLDESCTLLKKVIVDDNVRSFLLVKMETPQRYEDVAVTRAVLKLVKADHRDNLHYSVDVFSRLNDKLVSSCYSGQSYQYVKDKTLVDTFNEYPRGIIEQSYFAKPRTIAQFQAEAVRVITIYQTSSDYGKNGFAAVSIDADKLISYVTTEQTDSGSKFLLVDSKGQVVLDTSSELNDQVLEFLDAYADDLPFTREVGDQRMRILKNKFGLFGWTCVQMVPLDELEKAISDTWKLVMQIIVLGMLIAFIISYLVTNKLFRPVSAILHLLEEPENQTQVCEENDEYRYLLTQILELFEKNITLETDMAERTIALRNARAKALQGQMTPHFLNNVLQCINWLAIRDTKDQDSKTSKAITLLADIIRLGKEQNTNFTAVKDEVAYTEKFVELERLRYGEEIRCVFQVNSELETWPIPCLSLQVLVENAIIHGLQPVGAEGTIYVSVNTPDGQSMEICVEDTGVGISDEAVQQILANISQEYIYLGSNLGLTNLFQRFRLLYGQDCVFRIERSAYGGTSVTIIVEKAAP